MSRHDLPFPHEEIARALTEQILRGEFDNPGRLPSERRLMERFGVQRNTVRRALSLLAKNGHISTEEKRGSYLMRGTRRPAATAILLDMHAEDAPNLTRLKEGLTKVAEQAGYTVRMFDSRPKEGTALDPIPNAEGLDPDVAGAIIWPQNPTNVEALLQLRRRIPIVLVDRRVVGLSADCVRFADTEGARAITEHLIAVGHRKIGFIGDDVFAETVQHRWQGYVSAMEDAGIPVDPHLTLFFNGIDGPFFAMAIRYLLGHGTEAPTALMCSNDIVAFQLLRFLYEEGVKVPDDVAVTGYGNSLPGYLNAMALTSVDQPFFELGQTAARLLIERMGHVPSERIHSVTDIEIPVRLTVRKSSGAHAPPVAL